MPIIRKTKRKILLKLAENNLHGYELAKGVGVSITGIYQHLKELTEEGLIKPERQNHRIVYSLTTKGALLVKTLRM